MECSPTLSEKMVLHTLTYRRDEMAIRVIEIRPGEGGSDAKLLVEDMAQVYSKLAIRMNWTVD